MLAHLVTSFATLPDPRCAGRTRHRFLDMLVIAVCAVVAGAETWVDIANYGRMKHVWLASFLEVAHGIPSHDTFRRVFSLVDPQGFERCFRQWAATVGPPLPREVVAVDGKTVRRSFDKGRGQGPLHVVSAFATQQGLSLGQTAVSGKAQELSAIPALLGSLCLAGTIVTLDALGCQQAIARQILAQQADYVLALKGNQGTRHRAVVAYCQATCFDRWATQKADYDALDRSHGRLVRRRAWVLPVTDELLAALLPWPGLRAIIAIETIRQVRHQPGTHAEIRYYLTSCPDAPAVLIQAVRRHWVIENSLHWVLDVVFREDEARSRDRVATRSFAVLRKLAFNLLQQDKSPNSLRTRRQNAGWNDDYMAQLLTGSRQRSQLAQFEF